MLEELKLLNFEELYFYHTYRHQPQRIFIGQIKLIEPHASDLLRQHFLQELAKSPDTAREIMSALEILDVDMSDFLHFLAGGPAAKPMEVIQPENKQPK